MAFDGFLLCLGIYVQVACRLISLSIVFQLVVLNPKCFLALLYFSGFVDLWGGRGVVGSDGVGNNLCSMERWMPPL